MNNNLPYYELLGVNPGTDFQNVRKAFREKAKIYHPDVNHDPYASAMFIRIRKAFEKIAASEYDLINVKKSRESKDPRITRSRTSKCFHTTAGNRGRSSGHKDEIDFTGSRQGKIIYCAAHVIFILIGLAIFINPIIIVLQQSFDPFRPLFDSIIAVIVVMIFGMLMIWRISVSFASFIRKHS